MRFRSFAKMNWILNVLGRRPDSYHEISTVLQTIDLADRITVEPLSAPRIELTTEGQPVAQGEENLVHRAACLLRRKTSIRTGARIHLEKRIPVGAGLGGGSSNAAVTLLALNRLWECGLATEALESLGRQLGSDVPFFLHGGTAWGGGRGDRIESLPDPPAEEIVLCYPGFAMHTAEAYSLGGWGAAEEAAGRLTKAGAGTKIRRFCDYAEGGRRVHVLIENDFDAPLLKRFPKLAEIHQAMEKAGCERVALCGSGSTMFGVPLPGRSQAVAERLSQTGTGRVFESRTLSRRHYRAALQKFGIEPC